MIELSRPLHPDQWQHQWGGGSLDTITRSAFEAHHFGALAFSKISIV